MITGGMMEQLIPIVRSVKPYFLNRERALHVREKGLADFVTQVDVQVQEYVKQRLKECCPDIQFMGEEQDNSQVDFSGPVWILDPVDGTTNLVHDYRCSALSLALWDGEGLRIGIVYQPYTEELFFAEKGKGAYLNGDRIHVSDVKTLEGSLVSIGTSPYHHELAEENFKLFKEVFLRCSDIRRLGSAAVDLAYVACGRTDAFFERNLKLWDFAAGILLVEEAGGAVTDFQGMPIHPAAPSDVVAGNGTVGDLLVNEILK